MSARPRGAAARGRRLGAVRMISALALMAGDVGLLRWSRPSEPGSPVRAPDLTPARVVPVGREGEHSDARRSPRGALPVADPTTLAYPSVHLDPRWSIAGTLVLAVTAGGLAAGRPVALLALLLPPVAALLTRPAGRFVLVLIGALLVFQSSAAVGAPKLAFFATFLGCAAVSGFRVRRLLPQPWATALRPVLVGGPLYLGYLLLTSVVAVHNGSGISSWERDVVPYALLAIGPLIAVDAASTLSGPAATRLVVVLGLVVPFGFSSAWLARRGVDVLPIQRFVLATFALPVVLFAYTLVRGSIGPHRARWLMLAVWIGAILLISGTRTNLVLGLGILGVVGNRNKARLNSVRAAAVAVAVAALGTGTVLWLGRVSGQSAFLSRRASLAAEFLGTGNDQSAALRRRAYTFSLDAFRSHPLLGTGPGHIFPSEYSGTGGTSLDSPLLVPAKFGILGTAALLVFLVAIVVCFHRARRLAGWSPVGTTGRVTVVIFLALTPFGPLPEDKGFPLGIMVLLLLLGVELREATAARGRAPAHPGILDAPGVSSVAAFSPAEPRSVRAYRGPEPVAARSIR